MTEKTNSLISKYSSFPIVTLILAMELLHYWDYRPAQYILGLVTFVCVCILVFYGIIPRVNRSAYDKIDKKIENGEALYDTEEYLLSWKKRYKKLGMYIEWPES